MREGGGKDVSDLSNRKDGVATFHSVGQISGRANLQRQTVSLLWNTVCLDKHMEMV